MWRAAGGEQTNFTYFLFIINVIVVQLLSAENPAANIVGRWILSLKAKVKVSVFLVIINMGVW